MVLFTQYFELVFTNVTIKTEVAVLIYFYFNSTALKRNAAGGKSR